MDNIPIPTKKDVKNLKKKVNKEIKGDVRNFTEDELNEIQQFTNEMQKARLQ